MSIERLYYRGLGFSLCTFAPETGHRGLKAQARKPPQMRLLGGVLLCMGLGKGHGSKHRGS